MSDLESKLELTTQQNTDKAVENKTDKDEMMAKIKHLEENAEAEVQKNSNQGAEI